MVLCVFKDPIKLLSNPEAYEGCLEYSIPRAWHEIQEVGGYAHCQYFIDVLLLQDIMPW